MQQRKTGAFSLIFQKVITLFFPVEYFFWLIFKPPNLQNRWGNELPIHRFGKDINFFSIFRYSNVAKMTSPFWKRKLDQELLLTAVNPHKSILKVMHNSVGSLTLPITLFSGDFCLFEIVGLQALNPFQTGFSETPARHTAQGWWGSDKPDRCWCKASALLEIIYNFFKCKLQVPRLYWLKNLSLQCAYTVDAKWNILYNVNVSNYMWYFLTVRHIRSSASVSYLHMSERVGFVYQIKCILGGGINKRKRNENGRKLKLVEVLSWTERDASKTMHNI